MVITDFYHKQQTDPNSEIIFNYCHLLVMSTDSLSPPHPIKSGMFSLSWNCITPLFISRSTVALFSQSWQPAAPLKTSQSSSKVELLSRKHDWHGRDLGGQAGT